jgi:hypothetical protein
MAKQAENPFKVFLSHDTRDEDICSKVFHVLRKICAHPYMYERFPQYQKDISQDIRDVLKICPLCLCFLTYNGITSQWVHQELGAAYAFDRVIVPIIEDGVGYKGFVQFRPHVKYNPTNWESFAYDIIFAVRQELLGHDEGGEVHLQCKKGHEDSYALPSTEEVNGAIKANTVFVFWCSTCNSQICVSPWTFEEV